jgi:Fur family transcriptional regulator, ferric uptake regulator
LNSPLRMTNQRRIIVEELSKVRSHPTAVEIFEMVRRRLPKISLGTVYRNLEFLSETGVIQKLEMAGSQKRFDGTAANHYHIRCVMCHRVDDVPLNHIAMIDDILRRISDYKILWHKLEFMGICPECGGERAGYGNGEFGPGSEPDPKLC